MLHLIAEPNNRPGGGDCLINLDTRVGCVNMRSGTAGFRSAVPFRQQSVDEEGSRGIVIADEVRERRGGVKIMKPRQLLVNGKKTRMVGKGGTMPITVKERSERLRAGTRWS